MSGAVILNWVLGAIIVLIIVGGGFYAAFRHGKAGPNYREARRHYRAKEDPSVRPLSDHVPGERVVAADGLTVAHTPLDDAGAPAAGEPASPAENPGREGPARQA